VAEYDPLTISDEDLKALPPAERAKVYKARAAARAGGGAAAPASAATTAGGTTSQADNAPAAAPAASSSSTSVSPPAATTAAAESTTARSESPPTAATAAAASGAAPSESSPAASAPPKPAAPATAAPQEPEKPSEPPFVQHVLQAIDGSSFQWRHGYAEIKVPRERLLDAATRLKTDGFDYLSFITEVDWREHLELIYHLFAYDYRSQPLGAILRCELPRDGMPEVASLTSVWPGAEFMEREAFEMMGITFLGHPDLRRILLPDDFVGFPMRRDFETDWDYITVKQLVHESD